MPGVLKKINQVPSLYQQVVHTLKEQIISGRFRSGEALPSEMELAAHLGVSRPVVREALRALQSLGFVDIRRGIRGGAFVGDATRLGMGDSLVDLIRLRRVTVSHLFQVRAYLEPEICRLAARQASDQQLQDLRNLLAEYQATREIDIKLSLNARFHRLLARSCGNPLYGLIMDSIMDFTENFVRTIKPRNRMLHKETEHAQILAALEARDPDLAELCMRGHAEHIDRELQSLEQSYLEALAQNAGAPSAGEAG